jgi:cytochrome c553
MPSVLTWGSLIIALCVAAPAGAQMADGRVLAMSCMNCHASTGAGTGDIPRLNGKNEFEIKTALLDFREGKRTATIMNRLAKGYSEAEIDALAKYIATLK